METKLIETLHEQLIDRDGQLQDDNEIKSLRTVITTAVMLGLLLNWLGLYLRISMGFIGVTMGSMAVLIIAKYIFTKRDILTRKNMVIVSVIFGATSAAEAAISILFIIWLTTNISFYNTTFNPPSWLLPSGDILSKRYLFSTEWLLPLATHYFLMLVPGIIGVTIGLVLKDRFIHDDDAYPFPSVIQRDTSIGVLTDEISTKGPTFWKFARYAFLFALITTMIPVLYLLDLSNPSSGYIIGVMLGPVGISLFAAGMLIGKPKISVGSAIGSVFAYSILSIIIVGPIATNDSFEFFSIALSNYYLSPAIGLLLGGLILGPLVFGIVNSLLTKQQTTSNSVEENEDVLRENSADSNEELPIEKIGDEEITTSFDEDQSEQNLIASLIGMISTHKSHLLVIIVVYVLSIMFILQTNMFSGIAIWIVIALMTWILLVGGMVNGYIMTAGSAKSGAIIAPPFIFDSGAIFLTGVSGITPFVATPLAESDGTTGVISSQKLANENEVDSNLAFKAYIIGYIAATLTTPLFSLAMWSALGIGTAEFPAPAFPVQGAMVLAFATRSISSFLSIPVLIAFLGLGIVLSKFGTDLALGLSIGLFFPPHMALPLAFGGIIRIIWDRRSGEEEAKEQTSTVAPGLAVGGSFVIPILIVLSFL